MWFELKENERKQKYILKVAWWFSFCSVWINKKPVLSYYNCFRGIGSHHIHYRVPHLQYPGIHGLLKPICWVSSRIDIIYCLQNFMLKNYKN